MEEYQDCIVRAISKDGAVNAVASMTALANLSSAFIDVSPLLIGQHCPRPAFRHAGKLRRP